MKKGLVLFVVVVSIISGKVFAVESETGIEFYKFGATIPAKTILLNNKNKDAAVCYYLGEIYFLEGKKDSSVYYFEKGKTIDPNYVFNEIGLAKLQLKTNPSSAEASLKKIAGKNKKKAEVLVAVAKAYFQNGMKDHAFQTLDNAKKANGKYAESYVLEGDIYAASSDYGKASGCYEQALMFDANCKEAYIRYADIYISINPKLSMDILERLISVDPTSVLAQRAVGDAYYAGGQFAKAVDAYSKYAVSKYCSPSDLSKYALILFFSGDYKKSSDIVNAALRKNPNDFIMNRLLMYNDFEQKRYEEGLSVAEKFMNMKNNSGFIWLDYMYYGRLLQKNKKNAEALLQFEKAREFDASKVSVYKDLAETHEQAGDYDKAISCYETYLKIGGENIKVADYFALGKCNYYAGNSITSTDKESLAKKNKYLVAADSLFGYVADKIPNNYLGNFWRARANSSIDPETEQGLAKPYYEAALSVLDVNNKREIKPIIECYSYLGYYYFLKEDKSTSRSYWNKILELDPNNEVASKALKGI